MRASTALQPADRSSDHIAARAWQALVVGALGYVLFGFNSTATNLAFDKIQEEFSSVSPGVVSWVASGFFVASAAFLPLGGRLADRAGRRLIFSIGMLVVAIAALASWAAPNIWALIAARVLQAIGGALLIPASLSMALPEFPSTRRGTAVSSWAAAGPLSAAIAPSAAAIFLDYSTWRWLYFITAPGAILVFLAGLFLVRESKGEPAQSGDRLDYGGTILITLSIAMLVIGISQGTKWGWTSWATILVIVGALALFGAFIARSLSHPTPLVNVSLFRVPEVAVANLANLFISITSMSIWLIWPLWLTRIWEFTPAQIGLAITIGPLCAGPSSIIGGRLADRYGQRWLMIVGSGISTVAVTYSVFSLGPEPNYWLELAPAIGGFGFGWGLSHPQMNAWALNHVPPANFGETNAVFNTLRNMGAAVGTAGAVAILGEKTRPDVLAAYDRANIFFAVWVGLAFVTVAIGTTWLARRSRS